VKLVVCVKQIPRLDQVRFHEKTNRIVRDEVESVVNPLDLTALAHALALREEHGGEVVALTMGPPAAREALEDVLRRGANRAIHLTDQRFAGADTLATARALAAALERERPDLVLFGRITLDGATAQVPSQVAELAGMPLVSHAIELVLEDGTATVARETERGSERWTASLPAAVSVERGPAPPEPGARADVTIEEVSAEDLGGGPRDYGTRGSPTFVKAVRELPAERGGERAEGVEEAVELIAALLEESRPARGAGGGAGAVERSLWVLAERDGDGLHPVSLEGLACARQAAEPLRAEVVAVLFCADPGALADELASSGADRVLVVRHESLDSYSCEAFTDALCAALEEHEPFAVIAPFTTQGRDYAPRAAARLRIGLTGDFVGLEVEGDEDDPDLMWRKPAWAGTVEAPIVAHTTPSMGTLRPGVFETLARTEPAPVEEWRPSLEPRPGPELVERGGELDGQPLIDCARTVICVEGEVAPEALDAARRLAGAPGWGLGGTAAAVEAGLVPPQSEIDPVRRSIAPPLVIALGVREPEPLDAVRAAGKLVTVHPEAGARSHERADLAVSADPRELAEALAHRLGR
jgi:electron transfer flavoprotein alpha subunit